MSKPTSEPVLISGSGLNIDALVAVARRGAKVAYSPDAVARIEASAASLMRMVERGVQIYGVTTGIGEFARVPVSPEQGAELQRRIVLSHASGVGNPHPADIVRAAMLLRANTFARGNSGVRLETARMMIELLNRNVTPVVYEKGSLGVSGDLAPLAMMAAVCIGEGEAFFNGERLSGAKALQKSGLKPLTLSYKEGLGLINGSQVSTGGAALLCYDARNLLKNSVIASAMSIDALRGLMSAFDPRVHAMRPFHGQGRVAQHLRALMSGSEIVQQSSVISHQSSSAGHIQDGYSLRCTPQIIGPTLDAWRYVHDQVVIEMNSTCDNPLIIPDDDDWLPGGNFHSQNIALAVDFLTMGMAELANLSERHTNRLMNPALSGLPDFLVEGKGLNSGLMLAQYTAAALVSENKVLSHPAVVDSIPVSADQEDHVAMTPISVRKCGEVLRNVTSVLGIELMSAAQGLDMRKPLKPGVGTAAAHARIRETVAYWGDDRLMYPDLAAMGELVGSGAVVDAVESSIGSLNLV